MERSRQSGVPRQIRIGSTVVPVTVVLLILLPFALAQQNRPAPPVRDPHSAGYVAAKDLPDGTLPPADADGNFILGPTHTPAPESADSTLPNGTVLRMSKDTPPALVDQLLRVC